MRKVILLAPSPLGTFGVGVNANVYPGTTKTAYYNQKYMFNTRMK